MRGSCVTIEKGYTLISIKAVRNAPPLSQAGGQLLVLLFVLPYGVLELSAAPLFFCDSMFLFLSSVRFTYCFSGVWEALFIIVAHKGQQGHNGFCGRQGKK